MGMEHLDAIVVPVGGGGMLAGICIAAKVKLSILEKKNCPFQIMGLFVTLKTQGRHRLTMAVINDLTKIFN